MPFAYALDALVPSGADPVASGDNIIREFKSAVRERLGSIVEDVDGSPLVLKAGARAASGFVVGPSDPGGTEALRVNGTSRLVGNTAITGTLAASGAITQGGVAVALATHTHDDRYFTEAESDARFAAIGHLHTGVYAPAAHTHDDRYFTEAESDGRYAAIGHNHAGVYSPVAHTHDDRYYTEGESDGRYLLSNKIIQQAGNWDPPNLNAHDATGTTVAVPGAAVGDYCSVVFTGDPGYSMFSIFGYVSSADTVTLVLVNTGNIGVNSVNIPYRILIVKA